MQWLTAMGSANVAPADAAGSPFKVNEVLGSVRAPSSPFCGQMTVTYASGPMRSFDVRRPGDCTSFSLLHGNDLHMHASVRLCEVLTCNAMCSCSWSVMQGKSVDEVTVVNGGQDAS